jgi:hypothetical protein
MEYSCTYTWILYNTICVSGQLCIRWLLVSCPNDDWVFLVCWLVRHVNDGGWGVVVWRWGWRGVWLGTMEERCGLSLKELSIRIIVFSSILQTMPNPLLGLVVFGFVADLDLFSLRSAWCLIRSSCDRPFLVLKAILLTCFPFLLCGGCI